MGSLCGRPTVGRGQRLCLGVHLIFWKLKAFFVKVYIYRWVALKFEIFFKIMSCNFFKYLRAHTLEFIDSGIFLVDYYEVRGPSLENYGLQTFFSESIGVHM
jgi:hypothetical protein